MMRLLRVPVFMLLSPFFMAVGLLLSICVLWWTIKAGWDDIVNKGKIDLRPWLMGQNN